MIRDPFDGPEEIGLARDQLAFIVLKARAFDAETDAVDPDDGSNDADDRFVDVLESSRDNPNARELRAAIVALDDDGKAALVALAWLGRGDFEASEWTEAQATARERHNGATARYLMGLPLLGDLIEEGADKLGINITEDEQLGMHHPATEEPSEDDRS